MKQDGAVILLIAALALMAIWSLGMAFGACMSHEAQRTEPEAPRIEGLDRDVAAVEVIAVCVTGVVDHVGSGVVIGPGEVATAAHVVDCGVSPTAVLVRTVDGRVHNAKVRRIDILQDLAWLEVRGLEGEPVEIGPPPKVGDVLCSHTARPFRMRACGTMVEAQDGREDGNAKVSFDVLPGNSGSGVYDSQGRLVGLVTLFRLPRGGYVSTFKRSQ